MNRKIDQLNNMQIVEMDTNSVESKTPKKTNYKRNMQSNSNSGGPTSSYNQSTPHFQNYEDLEDAL